MRKCGEDCIECCDFCKFVVHAIAEDGSRCEPLGCYKHQDYEHQQEVDSCGCCDDFECFRCEPTNADHIRAMSDEELAVFQARRPASDLFIKLKEHGYDVSDGRKAKIIRKLATIWINWLKQPWEGKP